MTVKLLTSGGLGDAAMSFAKAKALNLSDSDIHIYHARIREDNLDKPILDFYKSQGIESTVIRLKKNDDRHTGDILDEWVLNNVKDYNHYLGTHWSSDNGSDISSWEIEPFPEVKYDDNSVVVCGIENIDPTRNVATIAKDNIKLLLNPSSGGTEDANKSFPYDAVIQFYNIHFPNIIIIGKGTETRYESLPNSVYNRTNMQELVNLISHSDAVITPEGFIAYLSAMCGKTVYVKDENTKAIENRKHPKWDMNLIKGVDDVPHPIKLNERQLNHMPEFDDDIISGMMKYINEDSIMLEYGSGGSTLYFPKYVKEFYSIEFYEDFYNIIKSRMNFDNVHYHLVPPNQFKADEVLSMEDSDITEEKYLELKKKWPHHTEHNIKRYWQFRDYVDHIHKLGVKKFDVVLVDGRARGWCATNCLDYIDENGIVFIDDFNFRENEYFGPTEQEDFFKMFELVEKLDRMIVLRKIK